MAAKIRKGDQVEVMRGRDAGVRGRVTRIDADNRRVWVENANMISRHRKGVAGQTESAIERREAPLNLSNVMLIDPQTDTPTRVGFKLVYEVSDEERERLESEGQYVPSRKVRFAKKSGAVIESVGGAA